ncbi:MAG: uroporphyrinogen-III synthase, partial [Candidatus Eremiobacteraeota bacterium]|nr:uroporphyrinogen-III synthase [Candidatus Eremiobacteraeota bacterium]
RVAAIGSKTAERLTAHGIRADFVPATAIAESVAMGILERTRSGDRILVYGAQEMRDVIPERLRAQGRTVVSVAAYKTSHVRDETMARLAEETDVWTFTSASTVHAFVENVPGAGDLAQTKTVACIGPITAGAARECGMEPDVVADDYTVEGLVVALEREAAVHALSR